MSEEFGKRLKELRKAAGCTQGELSEKLGVHLQTVSKWERGVSEPDLSLLGETASLLGVSLEKLLGVPENGETYAGTFSAEGLGRAIASARKNRGEDSFIWLEEDYILGPYDNHRDQSVTVAAGELFVMGDNRGDSHDSRSFGGVPLENVLGTVTGWSLRGKDLLTAVLGVLRFER